ncbi:hypothetical protein [Nocardia asteroides]|uniref:hypothetical protein n=1 Tax=Nocardia asteroides TaxID=1824 RepID=UPI001E58285B|nr:hypothetical protein [Nocardia asteroides]UGT58868.1 hypothetical protein LTT85_33490 [Nocardia asteroides]
MDVECTLVKALMDDQLPRPIELAAVVNGERFAAARRASTARLDIAFTPRSND